MTKTISSLLTGMLVSVLLLVTSISAHAASYWQLEVSTPATVLQSSTFNLDYTLLSTEQNETFTVELIANNTVIETQNPKITEKFGYNGRFTIPNVPEGTYTYSVKATNVTNGGEPQQSAARTVTVNLPDTQVVAVTNNDTTGNTNVTAARTNTTADGTKVATAVTTAVPITDTSSTKSETDVKGASDNNTRNFTIAGLLLLALAGGVIWYGVSNYLNKKDV